MTGRLWQDRGHAARIRQAARDGGFIPQVQLGLRLRIITRTDDRVILVAQFTALGRIKPSTIMAGRMRIAFLFTQLPHRIGATPADVADNVAAWLTAGAPADWEPLPTRLHQQLAEAEIIQLRPRTNVRTSPADETTDSQNPGSVLRLNSVRIDSDALKGLLGTTTLPPVFEQNDEVYPPAPEADQ